MLRKIEAIEKITQQHSITLQERYYDKSAIDSIHFEAVSTGESRRRKELTVALHKLRMEF
jgi:hypothetical protein